MSSRPSSPPSPPRRRRATFAARHLDPDDRLGEFLFGLVMTLTFTLGAGLIVDEGPNAIREMLLGVIGCNVAWGIIDAAMYLLTCLFDRSREARLLDVVRSESDPSGALAVIGEELDDRLEPLTTPEERDRLYRSILDRLRRVEPERARLTREDLLGAAASAWLVFLSTVPAVAPFLVFDDGFVALRVSNALLLGLLFLVGFRWGRATHTGPWRLGTTVLLAGLAMVVIAIALGG